MVGGSLLLMLGIYVQTDSWNRMKLLDSQAAYHPLLVVVLTVAIFQAARINVILLRKLASSFNGATEAPDRDPRRFTEELASIRGSFAILRDFAPFCAVIFLYPASEFVVATLRGDTRMDGLLIEAELGLFGGHLSVWMERFISPGLTDVMNFCYVFHTLIPVLVLSFLCIFRSRAESVEGFEGFVSMFLMGLVLYVLVPATGPMHAMASDYQRDLSGGIITDLSRAAIAATRVPRDAFPSLHVGISALMLVYAWRSSRWFGLLLLPVIVGNWISTVYLRYHYVIDVVAGFVLVPIAYQIGQWGRRRNGLDVRSGGEVPGETSATV